MFATSGSGGDVGDEGAIVDEDAEPDGASSLCYTKPVSESLLCCACRKILTDAVQTSCGHRICERCYKLHLKSAQASDHVVCPACKEKLLPKQCWRDAFADNEIRNLLMYCSNGKRGCPWIGPRVKFHIHVSTCLYELVLCPIDGCTEKISKISLKKHTEEECCFRKLSLDHNEAPNEGEVMEGNDAESSESPLHRSSVFSRYHMDLVEDVKRNAEENDRDVTEPLIRRTSQKLKENIVRLRGNEDDDCPNFRAIQQGNQKAIEAVTTRVEELEAQSTDLQARQKMAETKILEACYQSVDNAQRDYQSKCGNLEHHLRMMTEKFLKMEEVVTSQAALIKSLQGEIGKLKQGSSSSGGGGSTRFGSDSVLSPLIEQQFSQQDRILASHDIKLAEYGLRIDMLDCKNTEGVLLWKITEIRRRRREAVSGKTPSIYSQPFYTTGCGYKLCARLYLNGDGMGKGTHLSLFFVVMRGEYDALLPWPFQQKVTLVLMDQLYGRHVSDTFRPDPTSSSFKRPKNEMNIASGCPLFVSLSTLDSGSYIKDDTMFVKVIVDTANVVKPDSR